MSNRSFPQGPVTPQAVVASPNAALATPPSLNKSSSGRSPFSSGSEPSPSLTPGSARRGSVQVPGRKEVNDFMIGRVLGEGAYARVFIVRAKDTGKDYAMKVMEKKFIIKEGKSKEIQMERRVLSDVSHPNIVRLFFSFHDKDRLYMVLDLCPGGELAKLIRYSRDEKIRGSNRALSEDQTRFYLAETVAAVQHLHSVGILHRDVKPENVLISATGHVKLTDFGTAKDMKAEVKSGDSEGQRKDTFCGTAEYVSPEVLQDESAGIGADLWALGIMTHAMLVGKTPFLCESEFLTFQCILTYAGVQDRETDQLLSEDDTVSIPKKSPETFTFPSSQGGGDLSREALDLVKSLLDPKPSRRLGFVKPEDLRKHSFFQARDFSQLDKIAAPPLPYKMEYDSPSMDGAKQDWLVSDDIGADDDEDDEPKKKSTSSSHRQSTSNNGLDRYLLPDETILLDGAVSVASYGGLVTNRRHMMLTDKGRCVLIDPATQQAKEEMMVINAMVTIRPNGKEFDIQTPKKTMRLKDLLGSAERWKQAIEKL